MNFHNNIPSGYTNKDLNRNDEYEVRGELIVTVRLICVSPNLMIKVVVLTKVAKVKVSELHMEYRRGSGWF